MMAEQEKDEFLEETVMHPDGTVWTHDMTTDIYEDNEGYKMSGSDWRIDAELVARGR